MKKDEYSIIENHMLELMRDSAHDKHHIYRMLYCAMDIASAEADVDYDVLIAACLLHDIGREKQFADPSICHAQVGGEMAYAFLSSIGCDTVKASHVKESIASHRFRGDNPAQSIEAKVLFDADKLDVSGAMGVARTLFYEGQVGEPLYNLDEEGKIITDAGNTKKSSFFQEYHYKLKKIYDSFYTERAKSIALSRRKAAADFYESLYDEVSHNYDKGMNLLEKAMHGTA